MGYTTDFNGNFKLNKKLDKETHEFLNMFSETRRMKFDTEIIGKEYGVDGEFYVGHHEKHSNQYRGQIGRDGYAVMDSNSQPRTQPSLWCQWIPTDDGMYITWDGGEKFYCYVEWLNYIIANFLNPKGYILNGVVEYQGEDSGDRGEIVVEDNKVTKINYEDHRKSLMAQVEELQSQLADKILLKEGVDNE